MWVITCTEYIDYTIDKWIRKLLYSHARALFKPEQHAPQTLRHARDKPKKGFKVAF